MRITQRELDRYRSQLEARQSDAKAYLLARMRAEVAGLPVAEAREQTIEIMRDCLGVYGDQAQALSTELFGEVCRAEGIDADAEMLDGLIDDDMMQEKVRYYAGALDGDEPDWRGYAGSVADLAAYYVHRSALGNVIGNCERGGVRFARVPTGRETCGFCFMLASRGFVYRSEETAAAGSHLHCDCIVVPGVRGVTRIEGYDPDAMLDRWHECMDALGGSAGLRRDFDALSREELAGIRGRNREEKWLRYRNNRTYREVETRDNGWLYRGAAPAVEREPMARPNPRELETAERLSGHGMRLRFRATRENVDGGKRTSDTFMIVGSGDGERLEPLEFKQPRGTGKNNIYNQFNEASGQASRLVIDATLSPLGYDEVCERASAGLARRSDFTDVYVLGEDGLRHYAKE